MTSSFFAIFLTAFITSFGGFLVAYRNPKWYIQGHLFGLTSLSTGILTGLLFSNFLPHASKEPFFSYFMVLGLLFIISVHVLIVPLLSFLELKEGKIAHKSHHHHHQHLVDCNHHDDRKNHLISKTTACSVIGCLITCSFFDGFELNAAFSIHDNVGWMTSLGVLSHIFPDGILVSSISLASQFRRKYVFLICFSPGFFLIVGFFTSLFLSSFLHWGDFILSFSTGLLIYIVFTHLMPVSLKDKKGFLLFFIGLFLSFIPFYFLIPNFHSH